MAAERGTGERELRAALVQEAPAAGDPEVNMARVRTVLGEVGPVDLAVFPELFMSGYRTAGIEPLAVGTDDELVGELRRVAAEHRTALIVGAPERTPDGVANAALCIDAGGELAAIRRKGHLFGAEVESFQAGEGLEPVELGGWSVGVMVCFDLEFSEVARTLALAGADVLVTISANMEPFGPDHDLYARVRAIENGLPHLYVNRTGAESGHRFVGGTQAVDAEARVIAAAGAEPERLEVTVPIRGRRDPRTQYLRMRRPELYRLDRAAAEPGVGDAAATGER
jgi:predicted amidohydrolase